MSEEKMYQVYQRMMNFTDEQIMVPEAGALGSWETVRSG